MARDDVVSRDDADDDDGPGGPRERPLWLEFASAQLRHHVAGIMAAVAFAVAFVICDAACPPPPSSLCSVAGAGLSFWLRLLSVSTLIAPPCVLVDTLVFSAISRGGAELEGHLLPETSAAVLFYASALEGSLGRFLWLALLFAVEASFSANTDSTTIERVLQSMLVYQLLCVLRNLAVRVATRSLLLSSFEAKLSDVLLSVLVVLGLSLPHALDARGCVVHAGAGTTPGDARYLELARLLRSSSWRRKLDVVAALRLPLWDARAGGGLVLVRQRELVRFAKAAFRALTALPAEALPSVERTTEEIRFAPVPTARHWGGLVSSLTGGHARARASSAGGGGWGVGGGGEGGRGGADASSGGSGGGGGHDNHAGASRRPSLLAPSAAPPQRAPVAAQQRARALTLSTFMPPEAAPGAASLSAAAPGGEAGAGAALGSPSVGGEIADVSVSVGDAYAVRGEVHMRTKLSDSALGTVARAESGTPLAPAAAAAPPTSATALPPAAPSYVATAPPTAPPTARPTAPPTLTHIPWDDDVCGVSSSAATAKPSGASPAADGAATGGALRSVGRGDSMRWLSGVLGGPGSIGGVVGRAVRDIVRAGLMDATQSHTPHDEVPVPAQPVRTYPTLSLSHFAAVLGPDPSVEANAHGDQGGADRGGGSGGGPSPRHHMRTAPAWVQSAFAKFDVDGDGRVTRDEFIAGFEHAFEDLRALKASISGEASAAALALLADIVFWSVAVIWVSIIWQLSLGSVIVPAGTVLVSASFAIGPTFANVVSSLLLVLVTRPFDVGDRITASGLFGGDEMLLVKRINILTTELLRVTQKLVVVPNAALAAMHIENLRRSPDAVVRLELLVARHTTAAQLEAVRRAVNVFCASEPLAWKSDGVALRVGSVQQQALQLLLFAGSHLRWHDIPRTSPAIFRLWLAVLAALDAEGVVYSAPDVSVAMRMTSAAVAAGGVAAATEGLGGGTHA